MILHEGDNPALIHCRICGTISVPPYPGYYQIGVCSRECYDEWNWRDVLHILKKPYTRKKEKSE